MVSERTHTKQFPLKKLQKLIDLVIDNNLQLLEFDGIKIVPSRYTPLAPKKEELGFLDREEAEKRLGRKLTYEEELDEGLFGSGGAIRDE